MNAPLDPGVAAAISELDARLLELDKEEVLASFHAFVEYFWHVIEPGSAFQTNWHIQDVICPALEAVRAGTVKNLLINVPPGTSKSTLVSVMFPAWVWAHDGGESRFFGASYAEPLSIRDATLCRNIIISDEYKAMFPEVAITRGNDQKTKYGLDGGGWRLATSVGGRGTGEHPNYKIVDDPHNVKQSESDVERVSALNWFDGTLSSRGVLLDAATIVIMQRLHQTDLTGHIMASEGYKDWEHIVIPMRYEVKRQMPVTKLKWKDPRKKEGELLWPKMFSEAKVRKLEATLREYRAAGQLQQRPAPAGGGVLDTKRFILWPASKPVPDIHFILQSYDTAYTDKTENDPCAGSVWGVFYIGEQRCILLLDAWTDWLEYAELKKTLMDNWKAKYGGVKDDVLHPSRKPDLIICEDKGSGISVIQDLRKANLPVHAYNPGRASKLARAHLASEVIDADIVYVLESKRDKGQPITWARPLITQCEQFPNGEHDDLVDTLTQAFIYLKDADFVEMPGLPDEEPEEVDYEAKKRGRRNPYG